MNLKKIIFLRGLYMLYKTYFGIRKKQLGYCAKDVSITPPILFDNPKNVYLYEHTKIVNAIISTTNAKFVMKKWSGSAEGLMVRTGNHELRVGRFYRSITEKEKASHLDKDVIVEEDVWLGCNVTLLSGVNVGRGAVVGSGSVCRNNIPPYAVVLGNPAKVVGFRFTPDEIIEHEKILYSEEERLSKELLEKNYNKYFANRLPEIRSLLRI